MNASGIDIVLDSVIVMEEVIVEQIILKICYIIILIYLIYNQGYTDRTGLLKN